MPEVIEAGAHAHAVLQASEGVEYVLLADVVERQCLVPGSVEALN